MKMKAPHLLGVALGGCLGALFRALLNETLVFEFPFATIIENSLASFLLGGLTGWISIRSIPKVVQLFLGVGLLGSFSTMSALASDSIFLSIERSIMHMIFYLVGSITLGITLALIGFTIGRKWSMACKSEC